MSHETAKKAAAKAAIQLIKPNMVVGLGSGSTSEYFISYLIEQVKLGLQITAVSSSEKSERIASTNGILTKSLNEVKEIDITVDGADEIDPKKRMIKGGGGAHVREKILAFASKKMVVIVDETKTVDKLGKRRLPVEILPFGYTHTKAKLEKLSFPSLLRKNKDNSYFITDNGNYILDVDISKSNETSENIHLIICAVPGILDTGFFFKIAKTVIIGYNDGKTKIFN